MNLIQELYTRIEDANLWEKNLVLKRNEYLKVAGTTDTHVYFIVSGSIKISIVHEYEDHIIRFGYQNNFITALDSFITERPSDLFMQAIKKCELKVLSKSKFVNFLHSRTENKELWDRVTESLILQQLEREKDILISSPKERFDRVLKRSPQLFQEIPHKYIASYLRMTPETLSRLQKS